MPRKAEGPRLKWDKDLKQYLICYSDGRSRRRRTGLTDRAQAEEALAAFLAESRRQQRAATKPTVSQVLDLYAENHLKLRPTETWQNSQYLFKLLKARLGATAVCDLRPDEVRTQYIDWRLDAGVSSGTVNTELSFLKAAISFCIEAKYLAEADRPLIRAPRKSKPRERWLTPEEFRQLIKAVEERIATLRRARDRIPSQRLWLFLHITFETGARPGAVYALRRELIDFNAPNSRWGVIDTRPLYQTYNKRGALVTISERLYRVLVPACAGLGPKDLVLLGSDADLHKTLARAARDAGIPHVHPHVLRHTFATHRLQAGRPVIEVAEMMGDTVATVSRVYAKWIPKALQETADAVAPEFNPEPRRPVELARLPWQREAETPAPTVFRRRA